MKLREIESKLVYLKKWRSEMVEEFYNCDTFYSDKYVKDKMLAIDNRIKNLKEEYDKNL